MVRLATLAAAAFFAAVVTAAPHAYPPDEVDKLVERSLPKLREWLAENPQGNCTLETAIRRREW